jgi:hypothetical protein
MKASKPVCQTLRPWLRANLGKTCMSGLTGTDWRALAAAVHVVELYSYATSDHAARAFGDCVRQMQRSQRRLAYHAIAHVMDWSDRETLWMRAGLEPIPEAGRCEWEPGGAQRILKLTLPGKPTQPPSVLERLANDSI